MDLQLIGDGADRLVTVDIGTRGFVRHLYDAARKLTQQPLCLEAATKLVDAVRADDVVMITTGFPIFPSLKQETDGPVGTSVLARIVSYGLGALPIVLTEEKAIPIVKASCNSIGLNISDVGEVRKEAHSTAILAFPIDEGQALDESKELLDEFNPVALLAIEKAGRNEMGVYHSAYGSDISSAVAKIDLLVEEAETRKIPTIGIGDVGNEVGMGNIVEKVRSHIPFALECKCPCQGGTSSTTKVDILTVASVSNWGAYAIEACVSAMLGNLDTMHTGEMEKRCIRACVAAGAIDAMNKTAIPRVDGISEEINADIVEILRAIVASELSRDS